MMRSIRKLLTLLFVLFIGTCCAPVTKATQADKFIDMIQKLNAPPDPAPDEVPPEASAANKVARMTMYGSVSSISVIMWNAKIAEAEKAGNKALVIEINSPGGDTEEGFKTAKAIEESPMLVVCVVDGTAASEAFYLLQSCDRRLMTRRSRLMVHEPYWRKLENVNRKALKTNEHELDSLVTSWMEHAAGRMKLGPKGVIKRCEAEGGDWYMGWEDAKLNTAVDDVVRSVPMVIHQLEEDMKIKPLAKP